MFRNATRQLPVKAGRLHGCPMKGCQFAVKARVPWWGGLIIGLGIGAAVVAAMYVFWRGMRQRLIAAERKASAATNVRPWALNVRGSCC